MTEKATRSGGMVSHIIRTRDDGQKTLRYGRKTAIKLMCTECLGWEANPADCTAPLCPLFPFRGRTESSNHADKTGRGKRKKGDK